MGASLLSFFLILGTPSLGFTTLLIAHVMFCISFVVVVVRSRLIGFDRRLEEAAKDLGASPFDTFRLVTLPLIMPGIFGGAMLAFALSIDDFVISNFNSGTTVTFPLYIFGAFQRGIPVEVNCIAMILFGITVAAMGFTTWQQRRAEKMASVRPEQEGIAPPPTAGSAVPCPPKRSSFPPHRWQDERARSAADVEADQLGDPGHGSRRSGLGAGPASSASSLACDAEADRFAADPVEGLGGTRGGEGSTKARREGSSRRSRAREARVRPTMLRGADAVAGVAGGGEGAAAAAAA